MRTDTQANVKLGKHNWLKIVLLLISFSLISVSVVSVSVWDIQLFGDIKGNSKPQQSMEEVIVTNLDNAKNLIQQLETASYSMDTMKDADMAKSVKQNVEQSLKHLRAIMQNTAPRLNVDQLFDPMSKHQLQLKRNRTFQTYLDDKKISSPFRQFLDECAAACESVPNTSIMERAVIICYHALDLADQTTTSCVKDTNHDDERVETLKWQIKSALDEAKRIKLSLLFSADKILNK